LGGGPPATAVPAIPRAVGNGHAARVLPVDRDQQPDPPRRDGRARVSRARRVVRHDAHRGSRPDARCATVPYRGGRVPRSATPRVHRPEGAQTVLLSTLDWIIIGAYAVVAVGTGLFFARRAGSNSDEFFLGGRSMPWWLLGTSMVATTFSTDTPNLVTDLVRTGGVSQNWLWWAFLLTGMLTVFFYAKLWRRSGALTDLGFYELRYSGRPAAFLRGFRAIYLGVFFNVMIMATVTLAAIKIGGVLLGASKYEVVLVAGAATALYSATSGLWGVVVTDLLLFAVAMIGAVAAAYFALAQPEVGGLVGLFSHPALEGKLSLLPDFTDPRTAAAVFIVPIAVQWWSTWYPGAEPGGGGYVAQRMLAARDERHALKATLWFNIAHYALRPWPWILVALASLIVYPTLESIQAAFPLVDPSIVRHDLAYPAMLVFLPSGMLGLVVASL